MATIIAKYCLNDMNSFLLVLGLFLPLITFSQDDEIKLAEIRKRIFQDGIGNLADYITWFETKNCESSVYIAYKGFNEALLADDAWSPISKLKHVENARTYLNKSVEMQNDNLENRILRFMIELQIPDFLQKTKVLEEDKNYIVEQLKENSSYLLDNFLLDYFIVLLEKYELESEEIYRLLTNA